MEEAVSKVSLCDCIALLSCFSKPFHGFFIIRVYFSTTKIQQTKRTLCLGVSLICSSYKLLDTLFHFFCFLRCQRQYGGNA